MTFQAQAPAGHKLETEVKVEKNDEQKTLYRILANALEHFSNYGYVGASVREITNAAHVTKPTLYYYFKNKEELYRGLATTCFEKIFKALGQGSSPEKLPLRFSNLIEAYYNFCNEELPSARFVYLISVSPTKDVPDVGIESFNQKLAAIVEDMVSFGVEKGEVAKDKQQPVTHLLQGLFTMATVQRITGTQIPVANINEAVEFALRGGKN